MSIFAPHSCSRLRTACVALLLATVAWVAAPTSGYAQSLIDAPQTKQQAKEAAEAAEAARKDGEGVSDSTIMWSLFGVGALLLVGAGWWMLRDADDATADERRAAPGRPLTDRTVGRGAPKGMFAGDSDVGGQIGKRKKRQQGKRQRQARKANRPR